MIGFVAVTDSAWFRFLRERRSEEVNFWQPSGGRGFRAVPPGSPFFFKLKQPHHAIGGFGFFVHHSALPAWMAWETFGTGNGAPDAAAMYRNIERLRRSTAARPAGGARPGSYDIGCIILTGCKFFDEHDWVRVPDDFARNIVQGKRYDLTAGEGARIWEQCRLLAAARRDDASQVADALHVATGARFGNETLVRPRLGQGSFRIAVLDAYGRACAVSTEHSLPVLESAHIRAFAEGGSHDVANGICLRSDIHRLFDAGYVTIDEHQRFVVSRKLKDEYDNGKVYYGWHGRTISRPCDRRLWPDQDALDWHRQNKFVA